MPIKLLIIDALNLIRRIHAAIPDDNHSTKNKQTQNNTEIAINNLLHTHTPTHALCVFDNQDKTWRHQCYPAYKQNRKPMPEPLQGYLPTLKTAIEDLGVQCLSLANQEADDIIATVASKAAGKADIIIVSTDKTFYQLLPQGLKIYHHFEKRFADDQWVENKFGVQANQLTSYWALVGDSTNGLKGVPSIGPKTARTLLDEDRQLSDLLKFVQHNEYPETLDKKNLTKLKNHQDEAELAFTLTQLKRNIEIGISLKNLRIK